MASGLVAVLETPNKSASRISIGIVSTGIEADYHSTILRGSIAAAREHDVNLIVYTAESITTSSQYNVNDHAIYNLVNASTVDALVLYSGTLVGPLGIESLNKFCQRYPIPKVSIGIDLPNTHSILVDNLSVPKIQSGGALVTPIICRFRRRN